MTFNQDQTGRTRFDADQLQAFRAVVQARHSVRKFLPRPVPSELLNGVLEDAQRAPSNCNTQPWTVHILSGTSRDAFQAAIREVAANGTGARDFTFEIADYPALNVARAQDQGAAYYQALGIAREDYDARRSASAANLEFFGAPHVALLFMPSVGDSVRVASDIGMYAQTFLLSLTAHGLSGVPQTMLGSFADAARSTCGLPSDYKLLFGISFGYADYSHLAGKYAIGRVPVTESVVFHK